MVPRFGLTAAIAVAPLVAAATLRADDEALRKAEAEKRAAAQKEAAQKEAAERNKAAAALQAELQKVVVTDLDPASDGPQPEGDMKAIQVWQRKQQIRQHAIRLQSQIEPLLRGELELIRQTCGGLTPEARRSVLTSGTVAVGRVALDAANAQFAGRAGHQGGGTQAIEESMAKVLQTQASAEEFAAYRAERARRLARRRQTAQRLILADIDRVLNLSADQRAAIAAALEGQWQDGWPTGFSVALDNQLAPDFAEGCILPSLSPAQRELWKTWCVRQGWKAFAASHGHALRVQSHHGLGQGLGLQADEWWGE